MLVELFDATSDTLRKEVKNAVNLESVISATNTALHAIRSEIRNKQQLDELSLDLIIAQLKTSVLLILSASEVKAWKKDQRKGHINIIGRSTHYQTIKLIQAVAMLGLIVFFLVAQPEYHQVLISLGTGVVLLELILYFLNVRSEHKQIKRTYKKTNEQGQEDVKYEVLVDPYKYIAALREVIISIDKLLPLLDSKHVEPSGHMIEKDKVLLELFQGMVEATDRKDSELALLSAKRIPGLLSKYEIKMVYYDGENDDYFDFFPNLESKETITVYPALVKDKKVISLGRVLTPNL